MVLFLAMKHFRLFPRSRFWNHWPRLGSLTVVNISVFTSCEVNNWQENTREKNGKKGFQILFSSPSRDAKSLRKKKLCSLCRRNKAQATDSTLKLASFLSIKICTEIENLCFDLYLCLIWKSLLVSNIIAKLSLSTIPRKIKGSSFRRVV